MTDMDRGYLILKYTDIASIFLKPEVLKLNLCDFLCLISLSHRAWAYPVSN